MFEMLISSDVDVLIRWVGDIWSLVRAGHLWFVAYSARSVESVLEDVLNGQLPVVSGIDVVDALRWEDGEAVFWYEKCPSSEFSFPVCGLVCGVNGSASRMWFGLGGSGDGWFLVLFNEAEREQRLVDGELRYAVSGCDCCVGMWRRWRIVESGC